MNKLRIDGIDLARSLALLGMILVNFKVAFGTEATDESFLYYFYSFIEGKAAALFVFLAGIGISIGFKKLTNREDKKRFKKGLLKRALILFLVGILYYPIWPADILHFYSFFILAGLLFLNTSSKTIFYSIGSILFVSLVLIFFLDYTRGWDFVTLTYTDFWTVNGFLRHIFFNGFHPVLPWCCFLLFGLVVGRLDLSLKSVRRKVLGYSAVGFIISLIISVMMKELTMPLDLWIDFLEVIFNTSPMPPTIFYLINAGALAGIITVLSIELAKIESLNRYIKPLFVTGRFALTHYVFHVIFGMTLIEVFFEGSGYNTFLLFVLGLVYFELSVLFSVIWQKYFKTGPFEKLLRMATK